MKNLMNEMINKDQNLNKQRDSVFHFMIPNEK